MPLPKKIGTTVFWPGWATSAETGRLFAAALGTTALVVAALLAAALRALLPATVLVGRAWDATLDEVAEWSPVLGALLLDDDPREPADPVASADATAGVAAMAAPTPRAIAEAVSHVASRASGLRTISPPNSTGSARNHAPCITKFPSS
ncbi:hypothetical protein MANY_25780 [Mycolicibacterium anyangense]|uniref:Uncharacterized protein n=1 Tax=Mycolicibacterium anyangense TaxID=1431246 RepID=A0A6N4WDI6_9MYCO|nr:hypothetical protein MANY_25780 [Mycolicibacterium anyangense]